MSEDAPQPPEPSAPPPEEPAGRPQWRRIAVLAGLGVVVIAAAIVVTLRIAHRGDKPAAPARRDGGAAIHAVGPPSVQLPGASGVRLTGTVVDGAGLPVAGAEVSAELERGAPDRALVGPAAAKDAGVADAPPPGDAGATPAVAVAAPTAADGRFLVEALAPGRYRVRVSGAGLLASEMRFQPVPYDDLRIVVARQVAIDGTVTDGGQPVKIATVGIRGDAIGGTLEVKTDTHGAFHVPNLPEGRYQVYAYQAELAARAVRVARLGAGPFAPVELRLEAGAIVVGKVVDRDGGGGVVAAIELRPSGDDQAPRYARSGDDGVFRIEGVPTGRWIADGFAPGYLSPGGVELEAGHGVAELQLARGAGVVGRVVDADGHPIAGASVRALLGGGTGPTGAAATEVSADVDRDRLRRFSGRTAAPQPDALAAGGDPQLIARGELGVMVGPIPPIPPPGAASARPAAIVDPNVASGSALTGEPPPLPADAAHASLWVSDDTGAYAIYGLPKAKLTVLAVAPGYAEGRSHALAVDAGQISKGVDIVLSAGTYVAGRVVDARGAPIVGAEVTATPEVGQPLPVFSDADGAFKLGPLVGAIELRATAYGHGAQTKHLELPPPRGALAAERHEDLVLEAADATLAGTVDDETGAPVGGARLEVIGGDGEGRRAAAAPDGTFAIEMLPPGHVRVRVDDPRYPAVELDAIASTTGEHVHLRVPLGGAVEGVLLDATSGEPLAGMTLAAAGPAGQSAEAQTDKDGRWRLGPLRPGHWKLDARLPGYIAQSRELDVPAAHAPGVTSVRDVRIDLARGALVGGVVRDARGQRVVSAHVTVKPADGSGAAVEGDTDTQGEFRLHDCPTGELVVGATRGDATGNVRASVRPGGEVLGLALEIR